MGNYLSIAPTWWELLQSIVKQGYVYIIWKGDILKCRIENKGSNEYPRLELEWHHTYPIKLIEKDYKVTWSKNKEDLIPPVTIIDRNLGWERIKEFGGVNNIVKEVNRLKNKN